MIFCNEAMNFDSIWIWNQDVGLEWKTKSVHLIYCFQMWVCSQFHEIYFFYKITIICVRLCSKSDADWLFFNIKWLICVADIPSCDADGVVALGAKRAICIERCNTYAESNTKFVSCLNPTQIIFLKFASRCMSLDQCPKQMVVPGAPQIFNYVLVMVQ